MYIYIYICFLFGSLYASKAHFNRNQLSTEPMMVPLNWHEVQKQCSTTNDDI